MSQAFAVVIEETDHNFSAYVPDLPEGLVADAQLQPPVRSSVATVLV